MSFLDNSFIPKDSQESSASTEQNGGLFDNLANSEKRFVASQKQQTSSTAQGAKNILGSLGGFASVIPGGQLIGAGLGVIGSIIGLLK